MGLFSKLRADMNHGGLKVHIQAPGSANAGQSVPVALTITANTARTVNSATVELQAKEQEQGFGLSNGGVGTNRQNTSYQTVARVQGNDAFTINPGETHTVSLELFINENATTSPFGQFGGAGSALGGVLQAVSAVAQKLGNVSYLYQLHASLDVQDVGVGPSDNTPIQILPAIAAAQPAAGTSVAANTAAQQSATPSPTQNANVAQEAAPGDTPQPPD